MAGFCQQERGQGEGSESSRERGMRVIADDGVQGGGNAGVLVSVV